MLNIIKKLFAPYKVLVKQPAKGLLKYDYLAPAPESVYKEQWDWDAFFMGIALSYEIKSEAIYLKNWALNYIINAKPNGKVAGCIRPKGNDPRLNHMKPLLGQGIYLSSENLQDYVWIKQYWSKIKKIVAYREEHLWSKKYNLAMWYDSMESGADNNVASLDYPPKTVISTDVNAFLYKEYLSLSYIAGKINQSVDESIYKKKAEDILLNTNLYLWDKKDNIYYNLDTITGEPIKRISYSSFVPLWAKMLDKTNAVKSIKKYLLNEEHMLSKYGIRTLSKKDAEYNNINMIKPHSNWQGPIWPIANYLYFVALNNYGFNDYAKKIAENMAKLVISDMDKTGGMHENYDAETGEPLAAPNFISWNLLIEYMLANSV
jgi:alpha,alpha-trehalase